jgi:hypothetical protein
MKTHRLSCLLLTALVLAPSIGFAQRAGTVRGAGSIGCGEYLEDRRNNRHPQFYSQWVTGYISAYNIYSVHPQTRDVPDEPTVHAYLEKHCRDRPIDSVMRATIFMLAELGGYWPKSAR